MAEENNETTEVLSDDDIANLSFDDIEEAASAAESEQEVDDTNEDALDTDEDVEDGVDTDDSIDDTDDDNDPDLDVADETDTLDDDPDSEDDEIDPDAEDDTDPEDDVEEGTAKAALGEIYAPFKANGRTMQMDNPKDVITLMQQGANYAKKMQGLKPHLKMVKMLDNNGLLDEGKLNFLIDVSRKDPAAIRQLIKDSGIDPLDIDVKDETVFESNTYNVSDEEMQLENVLSDISDSNSFKATIDVVRNKWDGASKQAIADNPNIIKVINDHIELGFYERISERVERERALGRLGGMSDLQAYTAMGDAINEEGGFKKAGDPNIAKTKPKVRKKVVIDPATEANRKARKKSASHNKSAGKAKKKAKYDPVGMSDAEIENISTADLMNI